MSMISVSLPDGTVNEYASGITAGEIVIDIEGRKHDCVAAMVDGVMKDFSATLDSDCSVEGISGYSDFNTKKVLFFCTRPIEKISK